MEGLRVEVAWLVGVLLVTIRVAAAMYFLPIFGATHVPSLVRIVWVIALAIVLHASVGVSVGFPEDGLALALAAGSEVVIGGCLAFGLLTAYAATQFAGRGLDIQMGFGVASVLNPGTRSRGSLLGSLLGMVFLAVFLALDGHQVLVRGLAMSLQVAPPGRYGFVPDMAGVLQQCSVMFAFGLALAGPVMLALFLADLALAFMARSMPQFNVFVLSFAIKVVLGLAGLAIAIPLSAHVLDTLFQTTYGFWDLLFRGGQ
jgi:flagellar biosynthetic protein FliR